MKSYLILFSVIIFNRATLSIRFPDNDEDSEKGNELFKRGSLVRFPEGVNGLDDPTLQGRFFSYRFRFKILLYVLQN